MLVTAYYDIYNKPERFMEYLYLFYDLGISGIPIILFTDPSMVYKFCIFPPTVKVIGLSLDECELYQMGVNYDRDLPATRTPSKDTKEFFSLMNTKIEFVKKAMEHTESTVETFMWIDFGILKIVKNKEAVLQTLRDVDQTIVTKMIIPGCWPFGMGFSVHSIHWRFCGGFFVIPRNYINDFYHHSKNVLQDFCTMSQYCLTWETNVWTVIESCSERDRMQWFLADHNDSMIVNIRDTITL